VTYYQQLPTVQAGGGLQQLHSADDVVTKWLKTYSLVNSLDNNNNYNDRDDYVF